MKYIITEKQFNLIDENTKKINSVQKLVDYYLDKSKNMCESGSIEDENMCEFIDSLDTITVHDIQMSKDYDGKSKNTIYLIYNYYGSREPDEEIGEFNSYYIREYLNEML